MRRNISWIAAPVLLLALTLAFKQDIVWAASVTVNSTTDISDGDTSSIANLIANPGADGVISLREAIEATNSTTGSDSIAFNISGCSGVCTIQPLSPLPVISDGGTMIDGYTQPGAVKATDVLSATLLIEIDGTQAGEADCFTITSSNNVLMGLVINRFGKNGVTIYGSAAVSNTVSGNYIGTNANGLQALGNQSRGVYIQFSSHNLIGGNSPSDRNVISGNNGSGVHLHTQTTENTVSGNYIGLNANGMGILPNKSDGVTLSSLATRNIIGGDTVGERNVISGNDGDGVSISSSGNVVSGNHIGTDLTGTVCRGNGTYWEGVTIWAGHDNIIGGNLSGEGNLIACNGVAGARITGSNAISNTVVGNVILANQQMGVSVDNGAARNIIGPDNIITYNGKNGVIVANSGFTLNFVGPRNVIAYNGRQGVYVSGTGRATISQNSIYANQYLGIEYGAEFIPRPIITSATCTGTSNIFGTACPGCIVEVFENSNTDGEGEAYLENAIANASGAFTITVGALNKRYLTATATDAVDGTSVFSTVFPVTAQFNIYLPTILNNYQ
ncbi:MAG: right-handed parallel beta-helix repeat-containing protein [Chloroflexi bacterium]|nr:right-handed parallel beta-helix repeat-containing protein [Chloroflexota bacterium]